MAMEIDKHVWRTGTRPCDLSLVLQGGSVFADFVVDSEGLISLVRISFDGYGCCHPKEHATNMSPEDSRLLRQAFDLDDLANDGIRDLLRRYFRQNQTQLWEDALEEHALL